MAADGKEGDGGSSVEPPLATATKPRPSRLCLNEEQREAMRAAGAFNAQLMDFIREHIRQGVSTNEIDKLVCDYTVDHGHVPACLGYRGFPKSLCTSVNEVVCHGIPDDYRLDSGDIINIDLTSIVDGWHGDQSETFLIGEVTEEARKLTQCAFDALWAGIDAIAEPGSRVVKIGQAIVKLARRQNFTVVRTYQGHGIGRNFHQSPQVPHYPDDNSGAFVLEPGICFTIEPMINAGTWKTELNRKDKWTVWTADRRLTAQFEHTVLMTEKGAEVLTITKTGPQKGHRF